MLTFPRDPHSFSNPRQVIVSHVGLNLTVTPENFAQKQLAGIATLQVTKQVSSATEIILDIDKLDISSVKVDGVEVKNYTIGEPVAFIGQAVTIPLPAEKKYFTITIEYKTDKEAKGLFWRAKEQTDDKTHAMLYSHSQPTYASSWFPAQHSPQVRCTYDVTIQTSTELMALMSSPDNPKQRNDSGRYHFKVKRPIPSYLCAFAVGRFEYQALGPRTGLYAESANMKKAAYDFAENEQVLTKAEHLFGEYDWEQYNVLILPVDFPAGAMENPCLSFFSNEFVVGDRSRRSVVNHELAHSWAGNKVTAALWGDLSLNEGLTTYCEWRLSHYQDASLADMEAIIYEEKLNKELKTLSEKNPELTALCVDLQGRNPRDNFTGIPYYKGFLFFRMLENVMGREKLDTFLKQYFNQFAFQSMTVSLFKEFLIAYLRRNELSPIDLRIDEWLVGRGRDLPKNAPVIESKRSDQVEIIRITFSYSTHDTIPDDLNKFQNIDWEYFLNRLASGLVGRSDAKKKLGQLNDKFRLDTHSAINVRQAWLMTCLELNYTPSYQALADFVVLRKKPVLVSKVLSGLVKTEEGMPFAKEIYRRGSAVFDARAKQAMDAVFAGLGFGKDSLRVLAEFLQVSPDATLGSSSMPPAAPTLTQLREAQLQEAARASEAQLTAAQATLAKEADKEKKGLFTC